MCQRSNTQTDILLLSPDAAALSVEVVQSQSVQCSVKLKPEGTDKTWKLLNTV